MTRSGTVVTALCAIAVIAAATATIVSVMLPPEARSGPVAGLASIVISPATAPPSTETPTPTPTPGHEGGTTAVNPAPPVAVQPTGPVPEPTEGDDDGGKGGSGKGQSGGGSDDGGTSGSSGSSSGGNGSNGSGSSNN
jgi:uncharacterized membrane protein YgcG